MQKVERKEDVIEYKILLLGDSDSNKRRIFNKIIYNKIDKLMTSTLGVDFETKNITYKNKNYSIRLFDSAGQERFQSVTKAYYHMADGFFIVFNLSNENSLNSIKRWIDSSKEVIENPRIVILGHETQNNNNIPEKIINEYLKNYSEYKFLKVCPEKNKNIQEALYTMIDLLDGDYEEENIKEQEEFFKINKVKQRTKDLKKNQIFVDNKNEMKNDSKSLFNNHKLKKYLNF